MDYPQLIELLRGHTVYIQTHDFPDPDAIASAYGLQRFLAHFSIPSKLCCPGSIDRLSVKRLLKVCEIELDPGPLHTGRSASDYIITVDTQPAGANRTELLGEEVACIDHHPPAGTCPCRYEDIRPVGACSSIILQYYAQAGVPLEQAAATALAYGIKIDTACFTRGVTVLDADMFAFTFRSANEETLSALSANMLELSDLRAYGTAANNAVIVGRVGFAVLPFPCPDAMIAAVSDFLLSVDVVDVAVIYSIRPGGLKFSVRSERAGIDAGLLIQAALAGLGSGGGHSYMAGGFMPQSQLADLGDDMDTAVRQRFLSVILDMDPTAVS